MPKGRRSKYNLDDMPGLFDELDLAPQPAAAAEKPAPEPAGAAADIYFMSFGSGSSGNCAYIGDGTNGFLIDAGVDPDRVFDTLLHNGVSADAVKGIIVTHDHGDHIRYVYSFVRRQRNMAVFCTPKTLAGIMRRHSISRRLKDYHHPIYKEFPFKIGAFEITPFEVSHDGTDNVGYFVSRGAHRFAIATDLGCITDRVDYYMSRATLMMIESNYDLEMLRNGPYPEYLKARIAAPYGHLDNEITGEFVSRVYHPGLRAVFLCHLSSDNNRPEKAVEVVGACLAKAHPGLVIGNGSNDIASRSADMQLMPLPRFEASPMFRFR